MDVPPRIKFVCARVACHVLSALSLFGATLRTGPRNALKYRRFCNLSRLSQSKLDRNEYTDAAEMATELIAFAEGRFSGDWNVGNALHHGHRILGLVALRTDRLDDAKKHLLLSVVGVSSPQLASFGPNMQLASELLRAGEVSAVRQYMRECAGFWVGGTLRLRAWSAAIEAGTVPNFGYNAAIV